MSFSLFYSAKPFYSDISPKPLYTNMYKFSISARPDISSLPVKVTKHRLESFIGLVLTEIDFVSQSSFIET